MLLKKTDREFFRKLRENLIVKNQQLNQCHVADCFVSEGIAWQTGYNALN
jgi:hypothetical protein